jgi:hypothetical protein
MDRAARTVLGADVGITVAGAMSAGAAGTLTGAAAEPVKVEAWSLEFGSIMPAVQVPSRFEKDVVRTLSNPTGELRNSHARTPHHLLSGTITPNSLHFSINHSGVPVLPDGTNLPPGSGTPAQGAKIYAEKCVAWSYSLSARSLPCHAPRGARPRTEAGSQLGPRSTHSHPRGHGSGEGCCRSMSRPCRAA